MKTTTNMEARRVVAVDGTSYRINASIGSLLILLSVDDEQGYALSVSDALKLSQALETAALEVNKRSKAKEVE